MSLLKAVSSALSDGFGTVADVGAYGDVTGFMDTGSYSLNALISGSLFGGFPTNKITGFAGEKSTGKTFFIIRGIKGFLDIDPENEVLIFDSEAAITRAQLEAQGIDVSRVAVEPVATVEEFRTKALNVLNKYHELIGPHLKKNKFKAPPPKLMLVLDSIGNLSTTKEVTDIASGSDKRDMTKQQLMKGAFRVLTIECGRLNVPMLLTSHVYAAIGAYIPTNTMSGGTGAQYAASTLLFCSKSYDKDDKVTTGSIIKFVTEKSRLTREKQRVESLLRYDGGIDRYWGLLPMAEAAGIFKKVANKYELPDGSKAFEKAILRHPEKFFTQPVLEKIDEWCGKRFKYVSGAISEDSASENEEPGTEESGPED
jgi:RecA/RadA recombinase